MQGTFQQVTRFQAQKCPFFAHLVFNSGMWLEPCVFLLLLPSIIPIQLFIHFNNSGTVFLRGSSTTPPLHIFPSTALNEIGEQPSARTRTKTSDISIYLNYSCQPFLEASWVHGYLSWLSKSSLLLFLLNGYVLCPIVFCYTMLIAVRAF